MTNQVNDIMIHERSASILEKFASNIPDTINLPDFDMRSSSSIQNRSYEMNRSRQSQSKAPRVAEKVTMASYMRNPEANKRNLSPSQMAKLVTIPRHRDRDLQFTERVKSQITINDDLNMSRKSLNSRN